MACCGRTAGARTQYEVKTPKGTYTVSSLTEAKIKIAVDGGGTHRAVPATEKTPDK
jgi:hypothetical protein